MWLRWCVMWEEGVHKNDLPTDLLQSLVRIHLEVTLVPISICHQGLAQTLCLHFIVQKMSCEAPGGGGQALLMLGICGWSWRTCALSHTVRGSQRKGPAVGCRPSRTGQEGLGSHCLRTSSQHRLYLLSLLPLAQYLVKSFPFTGIK